MAWRTYHCWLFPVRPGRINTVGRVEASGWVALTSLSTQSREIWPPSAVRMSSLWDEGINKYFIVLLRKKRTKRRKFSTLAVGDRGSRLEEGGDERLKATTPAPGSWTEGLRHHRTASVEEFTEGLAGHQHRLLRQDRHKITGVTHVLQTRRVAFGALLVKSLHTKKKKSF